MYVCIHGCCILKWYNKTKEFDSHWSLIYYLGLFVDISALICGFICLIGVLCPPQEGPALWYWAETGQKLGRKWAVLQVKSTTIYMLRAELSHFCWRGRQYLLDLDSQQLHCGETLGLLNCDSLLSHWDIHIGVLTLIQINILFLWC